MSGIPAARFAKARWNKPNLISIECVIGKRSRTYDWDEIALCPDDIPKRTDLLIVDEVDRLKVSHLEELRDIYDGLVLIGMPGLERKLAHYAPLYSRVGFLHEYKALSQDEMRFIIEKLKINP